ncbi:hypothetical protein BH09BAC1_BH09BAC1_01410 [soil metagenome]
MARAFVYLCFMKYAGCFFLILSVLWFFTACKGPGRVEGTFTDEELSWLVYKDGDNLLFQNLDSIGDEVTLFVSAMQMPTQLRTYYPIEAEVVASNPEQVGYFKVYLLKDERNFKRYLKFGDVYRSFDPIEPMQEFKVGDVTYKEVYLFKGDSTATTVIGNNHIGEIYFAKEYGVVQYNTLDGRVYHLLNNELTTQR